MLKDFLSVLKHLYEIWLKNLNLYLLTPAEPAQALMTRNTQTYELELYLCLHTESSSGRTFSIVWQTFSFQTQRTQSDSGKDNITTFTCRTETFNVHIAHNEQGECCHESFAKYPLSLP